MRVLFLVTCALYLATALGLRIAYRPKPVPKPRPSKLPGTCPEASGIITTCEVDPRNIECTCNSQCKPGYKCCSYGCGARTRCFKARPSYCFLPKAPGLCKAYFPSFYYDKDARACKSFIYGGCGGNKNRFKTKKECMRRCGGNCKYRMISG